MRKKRKQGYTCVTVAGLILSLVFGNFIFTRQVKAEKIGSGARIIEYDNPGSARFHMGGLVGESVLLTVEPTGQKELTEISFTSSDSSVCPITKQADNWSVERKKEGVAVIRMTCKADGNTVVRTLLMSNLTAQGEGDEPLYGVAKEGTTVYYGCSATEGITSKDTEIKTVLAEDTPVYVPFRCGDFYRIELEDEYFGESGEYWGYVPKSQVLIPVSEIDMKEELEAFEGDRESLQAVVFPEMATEQRIRFESSNTNVVTVDKEGNYTAVGVGSAVVTAVSYESEEITAKCRIRVKPFVPVTGISILPDKLDVEDGAIGDLTIQVLPDDASRPEYRVYAEDDSVIKVYQDGHYEAKKPGKTVITAVTKEGNFKAESQVTVRNVPVRGIWLQSAMSLNIGESAQPVWSMTPKNATSRAVTWTSSNPSVASVDKEGTVTGNALGSTTVQIRSLEGGFTASCLVKVEQYIQDLEITKKPGTMAPGDSKTLTVSLIPDNTAKRKLHWKTSNSSVVQVTQKGKITAKKTGSAKITVYDRYTGAYDFCVITVKKSLPAPKVKGKWKKKQYQLSWKQVKKATGYRIYQYNKKKKRFQKIKSIDKKETQYQIKKPVKGKRYKIKAYSKILKKFSKFSNEIKIK